jgi:hypothetical protein
MKKEKLQITASLRITEQDKTQRKFVAEVEGFSIPSGLMIGGIFGNFYGITGYIYYLFIYLLFHDISRNS